MSKKIPVVRPIKDRQFDLIAVALIDVVNTRQRDEDQFKETVRSIDQVGLQKPICVNERNFKKTGRYELVCGEGRLKAYKELGKTHIEAEVINEDDEYTLLAGLAENLTRSRKDVIDFARRLLKMHKQGMSFSDLARITGKSPKTIAEYISLMENSEEGLIRAIEEDRISITFAMDVIKNPEKKVQTFLMNARLSGEISNKDLECITEILKARTANEVSNADLTIEELKSAIKAETKKQKMVYSQSKIKRDDAINLAGCLKLLWADKAFCKLVTALKLPKPELGEQYGN